MTPYYTIKVSFISPCSISRLFLTFHLCGLHAPFFSAMIIFESALRLFTLFFKNANPILVIFCAFLSSSLHLRILDTDSSFPPSCQLRKTFGNTEWEWRMLMNYPSSALFDGLQLGQTTGRSLDSPLPGMEGGSKRTVNLPWGPHREASTGH